MQISVTFLSLQKKFEYLWSKIGNDRILESVMVKLLGINFDKELQVDEHLNHVCLKVNRKLSALSRIKKFLDPNKMRILFRPFFKFQFKWCPLY